MTRLRISGTVVLRPPQASGRCATAVPTHARASAKERRGQGNGLAQGTPSTDRRERHAPDREGFLLSFVRYQRLMRYLPMYLRKTTALTAEDCAVALLFRLPLLPLLRGRHARRAAGQGATLERVAQARLDGPQPARSARPAGRASRCDPVRRAPRGRRTSEAGASRRWRRLTRWGRDPPGRTCAARRRPPAAWQRSRRRRAASGHRRAWAGAGLRAGGAAR